MFKKYFFVLLIFLFALSFMIPSTVFGQPCDGPPIECPPDDDDGGEPDYCEINPDYCEETPDGSQPGPTWPGYEDGRISPDPAEYYTIYCHEATDTIYVVRVVPENEVIKEISLAAAIALDIGQEQVLGDFMVMERSSEDIITIYGSNGNLAPDSGSKSFSLSACIESNGGPPDQGDVNPPAGNGGEPPAGDGEVQPEADRRRQAEESLDFCYTSYNFFGDDSEILVDCLNYTLQTYQDVLNGEEILTLIVMVFCLNLIVGNGVLPIGIVLFLGWHRRWLRRQQKL